jgi:uncharacterized Ntn-hydrolase superfamily protein
VDVRVDDHPDPVEEVGRLLRLDAAYRLMGEATDAAAPRWNEPGWRTHAGQSSSDGWQLLGFLPDDPAFLDAMFPLAPE